MGLTLGLILDTSILIESERRGEGIEDILLRARAAQDVVPQNTYN